VGWHATCGFIGHTAFGGEFGGNICEYEFSS
jgi:hypothetical protein